MPSSNSRHVFSYQTRVRVRPDEDKALAEYAALFGRVERTLYADLRKGQEADDLKSEYVVRLGITARQFNATRAELEGKGGQPRTASPADRGAAHQDQQGQENHRPARETHTRRERASPEAQAPGWSRASLGATGSRAESRPHRPLLRFEEVIRAVSPGRERLCRAPGMEAGLERSPFQTILRAGLER
jgi:hypothetical protein